MKIIRSILIIGFLFASASSCLKAPGEGGTSTIVGKVYAYNYNAELTELRASYYAPDEDVFIIYGSDSIFADDTKTNYDGTYRFQYLRPGTYKIFAYSKNLQTKLPPVYPVIKTVTILSENQIVYVEDIEIIN